MTYKLIIFSFLLFSSLGFSQADELKFVVETFRHGARAPTQHECDFTPCNFSGLQYGELQYAGLRQHYILGYELRKKYISQQSYLSSSFDPSQLYIESDTVGRCIRSATSQLYGLYPLGTGPSLPTGIDLNLTLPPYANITYPYQQIGSEALPKYFQAYPINVIAAPFWSDLLLYGPSYYCNTSTQLIAKQWASFNTNSEYKAIRQVFNDTFANMSSIYGINIYEVEMGNYMQNNAQNITIPSTLFDNIEFINNYQYQFGAYGSNYLRKLFFTPFSQNLIEWLDSKINNTLPNKMFMISGHDSTVAPIIAGFNLTSPECIWEQFSTNTTTSLNCMTGYPQYASNVIVELYQNSTSQKYYVKIKYNEVYGYLCEKQSTTCDYTEFKQRLQYDQLDYMTICEINSTNSLSKRKEMIMQEKMKQKENQQMHQNSSKHKEKKSSPKNQNTIDHKNKTQISYIQESDNMQEKQQKANYELTMLLLLVNITLGGIVYLLYQRFKNRKTPIFESPIAVKAL